MQKGRTFRVDWLIFDHLADKPLQGLFPILHKGSPKARLKLVHRLSQCPNIYSQDVVKRFVLSLQRIYLL